MMTDDTRGHAAPHIAETLPGADRSTAARRGGALAVIIATLAGLLILSACGGESRGDTPPLGEQRIEDPAGRALGHFYESLQRTQAARSEAMQSQAAVTEVAKSSAVTRVLHYGDSHVAADILTGVLRRAFRRDFGDAGPGFLLAGKPYVWSHRDGVALEASGGWRGAGLGPLATGGALGLAGVSFGASGAGEFFRLTARADRFTLYLLKQPGGGGVAVTLDGETYFPHLALDSATTDEVSDWPDARTFADGRALYAEAMVSNATAEGIGPHTLALRTLGAGPVRVLGVAAEIEAAGVTYDAFGLNGARAGRPLAWDWEVLASNLSYRRPALIVVAYGSNEVGDADLNLREYERDFAELLRRFRTAAPEASLLVIAPPDRAAFNSRLKRWQTLKALPALVAAQRRAALSEGAAFWDLYQAMGGAGSIARWAARARPLAQPDRVHLTAAGYRLVAESLYAELLRGYAANSKMKDSHGSEQ
jgi:lysophospholipase L1-like esterase